MESVGLFVIENIFGDFISAITGDAKTVIDKRKIRSAFIQCGDIIRQFENTGSDSFGDAVQQVFSKGNLQKIYRKIKEEPGYDWNSLICKELETICKVYDIEADRFITAFISMFKECIGKYDPEL